MRFWVILFIVIFTSYFTIQRKMHPQLNFNSILDRIQHPFDTRLRYRIGHIDPKFKLSEQQLLDLAQQATEIWYSGTQENFFVYDPNARLTINLIYDERQVISDARRSELSKIENDEKKREQEKLKLAAMEAALENENRELNILKANYKSKVEHFEHWQNSLLASHSSNSAAIHEQRQYLYHQFEMEERQIQEKINKYNQNVARLNQQVDLVNSMRDKINQSVDQFNLKFRPRKFDKGLFNGREINIYEFQSVNDLKLTLAHEFGHALGILHTDDPQSLMYPMMEKQDLINFKLKSADLELLKNRKSLFN